MSEAPPASPIDEPLLMDTEENVDFLRKQATSAMLRRATELLSSKRSKKKKFFEIVIAGIHEVLIEVYPDKTPASHAAVAAGIRCCRGSFKRDETITEVFTEKEGSEGWEAKKPRLREALKAWADKHAGGDALFRVNLVIDLLLPPMMPLCAT